MFKRLLKKKGKRSSLRKNNKVRKNNTSKKVAIRSKRNFLQNKSYKTNIQKNYIYPSIILFFGFLSLSLAIFLFTKQIQPFLNNERLKFLCTYQIGDKKNKSYKEAKIKLDKIVGDGEKFCMNFIFPTEKSKKAFRFMPILKNVILRFI